MQMMHAMHERGHNGIHSRRPHTCRRALRSGGRMTPLLAYMSPHALHRVRGPCGPRRIMGVSCALAPQLTHLHADTMSLYPDRRGLQSHTTVNKSAHVAV